jgi:hypothetical protein
MVEYLPLSAEGPGFESRPRHIRDLFIEPIQSVGAEWTLKLCLHTNVLVAAQALVAAITGEENRLFSLDLEDDSQLPGKAAITNTGQGSTLAHTQTAHTPTKSSMCGLRLCHICRTAPRIVSGACYTSIVSGLCCNLADQGTP